MLIFPALKTYIVKQGKQQVIANFFVVVAKFENVSSSDSDHSSTHLIRP